MSSRYLSFDLLRGLGLAGVVFLHAALYQYGGLFGLDMDNPPLTVTIIGFLLMWAGLFALVSGSAYAVQLYRRVTRGQDARPLARDMILKGVLVLILASVYFMIFGPALVSFDTSSFTHSLLGGLLHEGTIPAFSLERLVYVDALVMLGWNVFFLGLLVWFLRPVATTLRRLSRIFLIVGSLIVIAGALRVPLYTWYEGYAADGQPVLVWLVSQLINKNNPILPFLGFGLIGNAIGLAMASGWSLMRRRAVWLYGSACLVIGAVTIFLLPDTMLERTIDWTWYAIMFVLLGLFLLILMGSHRLTDKPERSAILRRRLHPLLRFGYVPLTVFFLETPIRELYAHLWDTLASGWNDSMAVTLLFGATLVGIWFVVLWLWERCHYLGSLEWLLAKLYRGMRFQSEKPKVVTPQSDA